MTKFCPICLTKYQEEFSVCPVDGMRLSSRQTNVRTDLIAGRYKIENKIGSGGMAVVYKVNDLANGMTRALKLLRTELALDANHRIRFIREAKAAGLIRHPNVVEIFDVGESEQGEAFMVMEYLKGHTVANVIDKGPIPIHETLKIIIKTALGLQKAHDCGVIHRDVKPDNILLNTYTKGPTEVKIIDFGLARIKGDLGLTATGEVFGTPEYISPEQATGAKASAASDQYGLGIMFYEMLTGSPPFVGNPSLVLLHQYRRTPSRPSIVCAEQQNICEDLDRIVLKMLAKKPQDRFLNLDAFCSALEPLIETYKPQ